MHKQPILITLTSPTAGGKNYLLDYIRSQGFQCIVSTTTRAARVGEVEGVDYYFISEDESKRLEAFNQFAELATYRGVRYGVTKHEFTTKLKDGLAFLIVEPTGIDHYVKPALDVGAAHLKYYIHTPQTERVARFKKRTDDDLVRDLATDPQNVLKTTRLAIDRLIAIHTEETKWFEMVQWDRVLDGLEDPATNLGIMCADVEKKQRHYNEIMQHDATKFIPEPTYQNFGKH